jgi:ATP adenylyltransferase
MQQADDARAASSASRRRRLVVHRGRRAFVLVNRFPYPSGHVMVAPYRHLSDLSDLDDDEAPRSTGWRRPRSGRARLRPAGWNLGWNLGTSLAPGSSTTSICTVPRLATRTYAGAR